MYYKVAKEECGEGIKPRYVIGQTIDNNEVRNIKSDFQEYYYDIYEDRKTLRLTYHKFGIFHNKIFIYSLSLNKVSMK